jgi:hypothetical protein
MKSSRLVAGGLCLISSLCLPAATNAEEQVRNPIPMAIALKLGPEKLTKVIDWGESEAGRDEASIIYGMARRVETEHSLALRDVQLLRELDEWRKILSRCRLGVWDIAGHYFGGGTAWGHSAEREAAPLEEFLSDMAKRLPLAKGTGSKKADRQIDDAIARIKSLRSITGDNARFQKVVKRVAGNWSQLKTTVSTLPEDEANWVASFAVEHVGLFDWNREF